MRLMHIMLGSAQKSSLRDRAPRQQRSEDSWPSTMNNEQPNQELIKCVVVGDTAVGKTRLICARACGKHVRLSQLLTTHIPTVWAIDQYRIYKDVLERSLEVVDSVNVSLRLWDTFGDHDKDRRFAYGRSDVVLLCFSIANPVSLRNCKVVWYPEIRQFCPNTPIILVGCKNDLRYMYCDEAYLSLCRDRSAFFRPLRESDLLRPEQGRLLAKEIGAAYYETSVLTNFGVAEVFSNVIRAALLARKQQRFWMTNLKHVQHPVAQVPFCPPKPVAPMVAVPASRFVEHVQALFQAQAYTDTLFLAGKQALPTHHWLLAAAGSQTFADLFSVVGPQRMGSSPLAGPRSTRNYRVAYFTTLQKQEPLNLLVDATFLDKLKLQLKEICLDRSLYADVLFQLDDGFCSAHRPLLTARCEMMAAMFGGDFLESSAKVVHFPGVSFECFQQLLTYLYGDVLCSQVNSGNCLALIKLADQLCLPRLVALIEERVVLELIEADHRHAGGSKAEEAIVSGSKSAAELLKRNGELLSKKLQGSSEKVFPERASDISQKGSKDTVDVSEVALRLLEPCQAHNADQLADWCLYIIATTYKKVLQNHLKLLRNLHPQNQAYLNRNRWPPAWYVKEDEFYQRTVREQSNNERSAKKICFGPFSFKGSKAPKRQT